MPKPAISISNQVVSRARGLNAYVNRMDGLYNQGVISRIDIERTYAGGLLSFFAFMERSIESLFVGLLTGRLVVSDSQFRRLIELRSDRVAYGVIRGGFSYANWLPYKRYTRRRAKIFFSRGRPFTKLNKDQITALDNLSTIRNALAHQSSSANRAFNKCFTEGKILPPDQMRPSGYLRGQHAFGQTRFNFIISDAIRSIRIIAT